MARKKVAKKKGSRKKANVRKAPARSAKQDDDKLFAFLASFLTIIGFIIAYSIRRDNKYVMHYAKEGLVIFIAAVAINILSMIPFFHLFTWILHVLLLVIWVMSWLAALSGEIKNTWLISEFTKKFNF